MKNSFASALVAFVLVGAGSVVAAEAGLALPEDQIPQLQSIVEQAMRQSPRMLEKNLDLLQSTADGYMARASSLPRLSASFDYDFQKETRGRGTRQKKENNEKFGYNVNFSQPLWHWGALEAARKISRIDGSLSRLNYGEAYRVLAAEVRSTYLGLVLQRILLTNAEHALRIAQENLDRQQERYNANEITYGQIMLDQLRLDEADLAIRRTRAEFDLSLDAFRALLGRDDFAISDVTDAIPDLIDGPQLETTVASSLVDSHPLIVAAQKEVQKAKLGLIGPKYNLYPRLGLAAGLRRDETSDDVNPNDAYLTQALFVGVRVHWTIFDGFSTKGQKLAALTRFRRAEARLASLQTTLGRSLQREENNIRFTWDSYQVAKMRLRMAREGLAHMQNQSQQGLASQAQIEAAQTNVNNNLYYTQVALAAHLNANVQYLSSRGLDPLGKSEVHY